METAKATTGTVKYCLEMKDTIVPQIGLDYCWLDLYMGWHRDGTVWDLTDSREISYSPPFFSLEKTGYLGSESVHQAF